MADKNTQAVPKFEHVFHDLHGNPDAGDTVDVTFGEDDAGATDFFSDVPNEEGNANGGELAFGDEELPGDDPNAGGDTASKPGAVDPNVAALQAEVAQLRQRDQEREVRAQAEEFQRRLDGAEANVNAALQKANDKLTDARKRYTEAAEKGDTLAEMQAQEDIADARYAINTANDQKQRIGEARKAPPQASAQPPEMHPKTKAWFGNNSWFHAPAHEERAKEARAVDAYLKAKGMDPTTDEFYKALDEELEKRCGKLGAQTRTTTTRRPPTAGTSRAGASASPRAVAKSRILQEADFVNMETFGLDPRNPADQAAYAAEKRAMALKQRGNR